MLKLKDRIKNIYKKLMKGADTPHKRALSCSIGFYIAFSPFFGFHSIMMVIARWLFDINFPLLFVTTSLNNPWTMVPFYTGGYFFGYWLIHIVLGLHPHWTISLAKIFGSGSICMWSFLVGGNVLGVIAASVSYPVLKRIFVTIALRKNDVNDDRES